MKESIFINGNVLIKYMLFMGMKVDFFKFKNKFFKIVDHALEFFLILKKL